MKHTFKRVIALLLAVVMIVGVLPAAFAAKEDGIFNDVKESAWYAEFVEYVFQNGLMNGTSDKTFDPDGTCTRAMAATVLYRIAGSPPAYEKSSFTDLTADWYMNAVAWAEKEEVVNGVGDDKFAPNGLVTREQLLTMIWRFAGEPEPTDDDAIEDFDDSKDVSDYAVDAFNWGIENEIINGKGDELDPAGNATRAEFAKIISIFDKLDIAKPDEKPTEPTDPTEPTTPTAPSTPTTPTTPSTPTEPTTPSEPQGDVFVLTNTLKAGDEVIIVCAAKNIAFSSDKNPDKSFYNAGVAVTPVDGKIIGAPAEIIWTVGEKNGALTFNFGGQPIAMGAEFSSTNLGELHDTWALEAAKTAGTFYLKNLGREVYLEWYESNNYWSGYYNNSVEELFALNFYVKNGEVVTPTEPTTEPTEPTTEPTEPTTEEPTETPTEPNEPEDAVLFYTNDIHTYIDKDLSYDTVAALKAEAIENGNDTLLLDAGDHAQGTAYGSMDKGETMIELMNAAGYDYATLGNHEFDYGMDGAMNLIEKADFEYLSANFYHEAEGVRGDNVLDAYTIVELEGKKIALVGITTPESFTKSTPAYFQDENGNYIYGISAGEDGAALYADVQAAIDAAKAEGAEIIIALGHLGDDPASDPWNSEDVIANTTGLTAFIDGHSHSTVEGKEVADKDGNKVLLTQTGEYFNAIGKMTIKADGTIKTELITACFDSDSFIADHIATWREQVDIALGEVVAKNEVDFRIKDDEGTRLIRSQETNLGDFAADALYYLFDNMDMDVDVAIMNGGGIRADMPVGDVSYRTTKTVHTFGNVACLQTITGQQLLDALEWGAKNVGVGENGGFLQVSGITYEIHSYIPSTVQADDKGVWAGAPTGEYRVKNVMVGGEPLDVTATYNLAGYNYTLRDLGDGFAMFDGAVNVLDYVMEDYLVLANYAKSFPAVDGVPTIKADNSVLGANYGDINGEGRIAIIDEDPNGSNSDAFVLSQTIEAGNEVIIVCAAKNIAFSADKSTEGGYYNAGVAVTPVDGKITGAPAAIVWTVGEKDDGYTFSYDGMNIAMGAEFSSTNLGEINDVWKLEAAKTVGASYLKNVGRDVYLEWYEANNYWSGYYNNSNEELFALNFYVKGGESGEICAHPVWNDGEVTTAATCTEAGLLVYTCTTCGAIREEEIAPLGHDYVEDVCSICGKVRGEVFTLTNQIADGKEIIIYYPTDSMVLGTAASGTRLAGVEATVVNDQIELPDGAAVLTIGYVDGTKFTLQTPDGKFLTSAPTGNGLSFADTANECSEWEFRAKEEGSAIFYIFNVGANYNGNYNQALEYYMGNFTTYGHKEATAYEFEVYVKGGEHICIHDWDEGYMASEPTCMADGELFRTCTKCGETLIEIIPKSDCTDEDGDFKCDLCGKVLGGVLEEVAFADLAEGDTIIIVVRGAADMSNKDYVLLNNFGADGKSSAAEYLGEHDDTMYWTVTMIDGIMKLCPNGSSDNLYSTPANNGLKIGKEVNGDIGFDAERGYLTILDTKGNTRYIGIYDNQGGNVQNVPVPYFRSYTLKNDAVNAEIANQTTTIYKLG